MNDQLKTAVPLDLRHVSAVDLALSGGGFRATLFHLGVIGFLRECGLLKRVKHICSVSGGSILAAHLVAYWNDYVGGDDAAFKTRVRHLVKSILTRDISGNVLKGSKGRILSFRPLDSERLVTEYRQLLDSEVATIRRWDDLEGKPDLPQLHILATHLNTGQAGAYSATGFHIFPVDPEHRHAKEINAFAEFAQGKKIKNQEIARAVAASSAFPPVFSPIALDPGDATHLLTDGGVYDNSGVNYLKHLYTTRGLTEAQGRMVIVSDAGREFPTELGHQYETFMELALRVTDTQADRIANADSNAGKAFFEQKGIRVVRISIHDVIGYFPERPANHSERVQELLRMIRTELDRFSAEEVFVLYRHGYLAAQKAHVALLQEITGVVVTLTGVPWTPVDPAPPADVAAPHEGGYRDEDDLSELDKDKLERRLENGHVIKKLAKLANLVRCSICCIVAVLLIAAVLVGAIGYYFGSKGVPPSPTPGAARGALRIAEVEPYKPDGWAAAIPTLTPVLRSPERQYVYTFATEPIGVLTDARPHREAVAGFRLTGALAGSQLYLFLKQEASPGSHRYVVLQELFTKKLNVAAGGASDRLLGVVVSRTEITDPKKTLQQNLTIELETP